MLNPSGGADERILVARLVRPRGRHGEFQAEPLTRPERLGQLRQVILVVADRQRPTEVESVWFHQGRPVLKFRGIDSMSDAEAWRGAGVWIPRSERAPLPEGEYYHSDLVGCRVIDRATGRMIGVVTGLEEFGGPPLVAVETPDGRQVLVPFARSICCEIDVAARELRVDLPEGLLGLDARDNEK